MHIRQGTPADFPRLAAFYRDSIDRSPHSVRFSRWIYGKHPHDRMLQAYLEDGAMLLLEDAGCIAAAMALTLAQGEDYHAIPWALPLADDEVAVAHILCVGADHQRQGLARLLMTEAIRLARSHGKKAVRLDALACNTPAHRLYESLGFTLRGTQRLYAENTGETDFLFFELPC